MCLSILIWIAVKYPVDLKRKSNRSSISKPTPEHLTPKMGQSGGSTNLQIDRQHTLSPKPELPLLSRNVCIFKFHILTQMFQHVVVYNYFTVK